MKLSERRKAAGFSAQEQLATMLNVKRAAVSKWEAGRTYPRAPILSRLAAALNVTEGEIISAITKARNER